MSVATVPRLPPRRPVPALVVPDSRENTTLALVTVGASNVAIALLVAISGAVFALGHRERMETAFFVTALALAPAGIAIARRQLHRVGHERYTSLALLDVAGLSAGVLAARAAAAVVGTDVVPEVLLVCAAAVVGFHIVVHRRPRLLPSPPDGSARTVAVLVACALLAGAVASFYPRSLFTPERLWLCVLVASVVAAIRALGIPAPSWRVWRWVVDALVLATTALVVSDVNDYSRALRYDYDFFLGPVNAMRHGHPLLVDTFSQYGVGMFYALSGAFHGVPLTYGGLQVVLCIAYALEFALVYGVLRLACRSQLVAVLGLAVALVANLGVINPYIAYPSTGPLRFGLPWVVIIAGTLRARSTEDRRLLDAVMLLTVGVAAVWSAETFVYSLAAYAAITVFSIVDRPEWSNDRSLHIAKRIAAAMVVAFVAVGATSAFLLAVAGDWPRWTDYLGLVALYAMRGFGSLLIPAWSPGYLVGGLYVLSLTALVGLPGDVRRRLRPTIAATAGATAFGAIAFTYFLGRSAPSNLHHVAVPAVVVSCGWWTVAWPHVRRLSPAYGWIAVVAASLVGVSVIASSSNATGGWLGGTPLVQVVGSPDVTASRVKSLLTKTADDPRVVEGARLVRAYSTSGRQPAVLIHADDLTAVLLAARRGNALPIVNGNQDGLFDEPALKRVVAATDTLPTGSFALTEMMFMRRPAREFAQLDPIRNKLRFGDYFIARSYEALAERFELRVVERGRFGYVVVQLGRHR